MMSIFILSDAIQTVAVTPELIIAAGGIITIVSTALASWAVSRRTARKDELEALRGEVIRLQGRVDQLSISDSTWRTRYDRLYNYTLGLRLMMTDANLPIPEMSISGQEKTKEGDDFREPFHERVIAAIKKPRSRNAKKV